MFKKEKFFSNKISSFPFLKPTKVEGHLLMYLHQWQHCQHKNKSSPFQENNQGVARFQKQFVLNSHQHNFCCQNARSRLQDSF